MPNRGDLIRFFPDKRLGAAAGAADGRTSSGQRQHRTPPRPRDPAPPWHRGDSAATPAKKRLAEKTDTESP
ncbi:MAG TPA: hypothetical protein VND64_37405, partial [Pirellulales bacterium]|nr:hypothetical protein [Pirellulales bacterium]